MGLHLTSKQGDGDLYETPMTPGTTIVDRMIARDGIRPGGTRPDKLLVGLMCPSGKLMSGGKWCGVL